MKQIHIFVGDTQLKMDSLRDHIGGTFFLHVDYVDGRAAEHLTIGLESLSQLSAAQNVSAAWRPRLENEPVWKFACDPDGAYVNFETMKVRFLQYEALAEAANRLEGFTSTHVKPELENRENIGEQVKLTRELTLRHLEVLTQLDFLRHSTAPFLYFLTSASTTPTWLKLYAKAMFVDPPEDAVCSGKVDIMKVKEELLALSDEICKLYR